MVKEELVEGIRQAISKGESIEKAMMSFYTAGYLKQDIEEAAAFARSPGFVPPQQPIQQPVQQRPIQAQTTRQTQQPTMAAPAPLFQPMPDIQPGIVQRVSAYGKPPSKKGMAITIILVVVLLLLVGMLAAAILFKDEISALFGGAWRALF